MSIFCISLISCLRRAYLKYFFNYFEMASVSPIITGVTFVRVLSASSLIKFLSFKMSTFLTYKFLYLITDYDIRFIVMDGSVAL
jgi:hypothetical protein